LDRARLDQVMAVVNAQLNPAGYDCIEAEWSGNERILRIFVDSSGSVDGIALDGCVKASRLLREVPALDDMIPARYTLEVSSPGVERPLRRLAHFALQVGQKIQVKLKDKVGDRKHGAGKLLGIEEHGAEDEAMLTLETEQGIWSFPLASLQRASLVYDWGDS